MCGLAFSFLVVWTQLSQKGSQVGSCRRLWTVPDSGSTVYKERDRVLDGGLLHVLVWLVHNKNGWMILVACGGDEKKSETKTT